MAKTLKPFPKKLYAVWCAVHGEVFNITQNQKEARRFQKNHCAWCKCKAKVTVLLEGKKHG